MPSEKDRSQLVSIALPLTSSLSGRLAEIAAAPPPSSLSSVVRYLLDIGFSRWTPKRQHYRIEMIERVGRTTRVSVRLDQAKRVEQIMEMGYGRAVVFDLTLRLGDKYRPSGNRAETIEAPDSGPILQSPEAVELPGQTDEPGPQLPDAEEAGPRGSIERLRALLRSGDSDCGEDPDSEASYKKRG